MIRSAEEPTMQKATPITCLSLDAYRPGEYDAAMEATES
jgi:hypothetical protein